MRRRVVVVLAGLLAGIAIPVVALWWWPPGRLASSAAPPPVAGLSAVEHQWIDQAQSRVADLDSALNAIAEAQSAFQANADSTSIGRARAAPEEVRRLEAARLSLRDQRTLLAAQIDTVFQVAAVSSELAVINAQLADLTAALGYTGAVTISTTASSEVGSAAGAGDPGVREESRRAQSAVLDQQRLLQQRRASKQADLGRLRAAADAATSAALPALDSAIPDLIADVNRRAGR